MKRTALIRKVREAAKNAGIRWELVASKGNHEKWRLGATVQVAIPRHSEINEITAEAILKDTEAELGARWWK
jgi:hypothetical protein